MALQGSFPIGSTSLPDVYRRVEGIAWEYYHGDSIFCEIAAYPTPADAQYISHPATYRAVPIPSPTEEEPNRVIEEQVKESEPWIEQPKPIYSNRYTFEFSTDSPPPVEVLQAIAGLTREQRETLTFGLLKRMLYERLKEAPEFSDLEDV